MILRKGYLVIFIILLSIFAIGITGCGEDDLDVRVVDESDYYSVWLAKDIGPVKLAEIDPNNQEIESVIVLHSYSVE